MIAHRGASGERPENTLPAYALAVEQGADMIEIDLHRSRDGEIVVTHDEHVPGAGAIGDVSLEAVRAADRRIPTLDEVLERFGARIAFNLELKVGPRGPYPGLEEATLEALARHSLAESILFSSFEERVLGRLRSLDRRLRLGVLVGRIRGGWLRRCQALGAEAVHFGRRGATVEAIEEAHRAGLAVYVYTVDEPQEMRELLDRGADGLFTNFPVRMRQLLDSPRGGASE